MPIVAHNNLPTFEYLKNSGEDILSLKRASSQYIREQHFGLLNMMPDKVLCATERQFFKLIGGSNKVVQFYLHPFSLKSIQRDKQTTEYIKKYYDSFEQIKRYGLDGLIITGANIVGTDLSKQNFYNELTEVINWAYENTTSTLFSCLATHLVMQCMYGQKRTPLNKKCWGIFSHTVVDREHPLVRSVNTAFNVPHSRFNQISRAQFNASGLKVLVESQQGVHLAVSKDLFRQVFFQGHPEYDTISLLKEYKRDIHNFISKKIDSYPVFPQNYLNEYSQAILLEFKQKITSGDTNINNFPEKKIAKILHNTWGDSAKTIMNNWTGIIYQITHKQRAKPFMEGIDPQNPLLNLYR